MTDQRTVEVYDEKAAEYAAKFDSDQPGTHLKSFIDALPKKSARVLDLGCGTGGAAALMCSAGLNVTGMDASAEMLKHAAKKADARWVHATFDELNASNEYDGVWANFSLLHAERDAVPGHLSTIHKALKSTGIFHIGMKTGEGAARDDLNRYYTYWTENELTEALSEAGFTDFQVTTGQGKGLAGTLDPWVIILSRKRA